MKIAIGLCAMACVLVSMPVLHSENVDPDGDDSQYGYSENAGWINAEPSGNGGSGVQVGDSSLSGWMWGENIGWISASCENSLSCATSTYGVTNDGTGQLAGFAWAENVGWISFSCANTSSCGTSDYGVTIDPATGIWSGFAWSENVGWISFNCVNSSSCGMSNYRVKTDWICNPLPPGPTGSPTTQMTKVDGSTVLSWTLIAGATGTDIVRGNLGSLRTSGGNYTVSTTTCLDDDRTSLSALDPSAPAVGDGFWYLVRGQNCGGSGNYDGNSPPQSGLRGTEITTSGNDCS